MDWIKILKLTQTKSGKDEEEAQHFYFWVISHFQNQKLKLDCLLSASFQGTVGKLIRLKI